MKKVQFTTVLAAMLLPLVLVSCGPQPTATPNTPSPKITTAEVTAKPAWETDWERTLAAAKKEGKVVIYTTNNGNWRQAFDEALSKQYGIGVDTVVGRGEELIERATREQSSGVNFADILFTSVTFIQGIPQLAGLIDNLERELILPEVTDPKGWWSGTLPWFDQSTKTALGTRLYLSPPMIVNTDLVRPEEINSWSDLLHPKWKGRILLADPTVGGGANVTMGMLIYKIKDMDFVKLLAKQEPIISRDRRIVVEWVARGKNPVSIGPGKEVVLEFMDAGAPIKYVVPSEGAQLTSGSGFVTVLKNRSHPNAARVFANFFLSRQGQALNSRILGMQSTRTDVPTDFLPPILVRQPGGKYFADVDKEYIEKQPQLMTQVTDIFKPLVR